MNTRNIVLFLGFLGAFLGGAWYGNELLISADAKEPVAREIVAWLKEHVK